MENEFMAIIEQDEERYIAYCPEIPGANGQGKTKDEARENLAEAIALILEDRRADGLRGVPPEAMRETVTISAGAMHVLKNAADRLREHMDVKSADQADAAARSLSRACNHQLAENAARIAPG